MKGNFVVKAKPETFNALFPHGIGADWERSYHQTLAIRNAYHEMTCGYISFSETELHHEFGGKLKIEIENI